MTPGRLAILLLVPLLTACPNDSPIVRLPGPVAQLQRFEAADKAGQYSEIAQQAIDSSCGSDGSEACPALYAIHGRACLQVARSEAAPDAACPGPTSTAKAMLDCTIRDLGAAEASRKFEGTPTLGDIRQNRGQALYCSATMQPIADGARLAAQAESELTQAPDTAKTKVLLARAALYVAARPAFPTTQRCAGAQRARDAAAAGLKQQPDPATNTALRSLLSQAADWGKTTCGTGG